MITSGTLTTDNTYYSGDWYPNWQSAYQPSLQIVYYWWPTQPTQIIVNNTVPDVDKIKARIFDLEEEIKELRRELATLKE